MQWWDGLEEQIKEPGQLVSLGGWTSELGLERLMGGKQGKDSGTFPPGEELSRQPVARCVGWDCVLVVD